MQSVASRMDLIRTSIVLAAATAYLSAGDLLHLLGDERLLALLQLHRRRHSRERRVRALAVHRIELRHDRLNAVHALLVHEQAQEVL